MIGSLVGDTTGRQGVPLQSLHRTGRTTNGSSCFSVAPRGLAAESVFGSEEYHHMRRVSNRFLVTFATILCCALMPVDSVLLAKAPNNQQKYNEAIRSAQQTEMLGYILAGAGILLVVAAIPLGIYLDRKKKARKRSAQRLPDTGRSSNAEKPQT